MIRDLQVHLLVRHDVVDARQRQFAQIDIEGHTSRLSSGAPALSELAYCDWPHFHNKPHR